MAVAALLALVGPGGVTTGGGEEGSPTAECAINISDDITIPTWTANLGAGCDYRVDGKISISGALTIDPGTEVHFGLDSSCQIADISSINAIGTADERITLPCTLNTAGFWYGLCFSDNRVSRLEQVILLNAGKVWTGGNSVCRAAIGHGYGDGEPIAIVDTLITCAQTTCLDATKLDLGEFARNVFAANQEYGVRVSRENVGHLDSASDYAGTTVGAANAKPYVQLSDSAMSDPGKTHLWPRLNVPYFIGEDEFGYHRNVIVTDDTHIAVGPGTTFVFGSEGSLNIWDGSTLTDIGTEDEPVVFTGLVKEPGS